MQNDIDELIKAISDKILDEWTAEAIAKNEDIEDYLDAQLDGLAAESWETYKPVAARRLQRIMGVA
jgi:hypothetical protein